VLLYGEESTETLDTRVRGVRFTKQGTHFTLVTREGEHECFTPVHGKPIILNLAGAFTLACAVGADPQVSIAAFRTLRPVSNRLEVIEDAGVTWIRDAYNSNQFGFRAALQVAADLPVRRRLLVTPGVVEMGPSQHDVNRLLAAEAARVCDKTLIVSGTNHAAFVDGFREAGCEDKLVAVANRTDAFTWLHAQLSDGDLVILENDLPDVYESTSGVYWPAGVRRTS
jgi:UDP-N-acetylmuramoyl-tripeptide--D-alanyl-D-alanine ligase